MFYRNVLKVFTGTGISLIIPIAFSPVIARLYDPTSFGEFGVFMFIFSILLVLSNGRLNNAINIAKTVEDSISLFLGSSIFLISFSLFITIFFAIFPDLISRLTHSDLYYMSPVLGLALLLSGCHESLLAIANRNGLFSPIAKSKVVFSLTTILLQLVLGFYGFGARGLIYSLIAAKLFTVCYLALTQKYLFTSIKLSNFSQIKYLIWRYKNFLIYDTPSALAAVAIQQAPNFLFKMIYSGSFAGQYFFIQRLLQAPVSLISGSVLEVFKNESTLDFHVHGNFRSSFLKTFRTLIAFIAIPVGIGIVYIQEIVVFIYGEEWRDAGRIAAILMPAFGLRLLANPLSFSFYLAEKQPVNLLILSTTFLLLTLLFFFDFDEFLIVKLISMLLSLQYLFYILYSYYLSGK